MGCAMLARSTLARGKLQLLGIQAGWIGGVRFFEVPWGRMHAVSKVCMDLLWEGTWNGDLAGGGMSTGELGCSGGICKLENMGAVLVPAGGCVFMLGWGGVVQGKEMVPTSSFVPREVS